MSCIVTDPNPTKSLLKSLSTVPLPTEVMLRSARGATGLSSLGVGRDDTVAMMLRNDPAYPEATMAIRIVSALPVPINWHLRGEEVEYIIKDSGAKALVIHSDLYDELKDHVPEGVHVIEVETPVLQTIYGGANARPFKTFHYTLKQELYLRIADELYLKRLIVGGFEKVYEISKNFRNEGMDRNHNPEFTMLEFYSAYSDIYDMMNFTESMIKSISKKINFPNENFNFNENSNKI